MEVARFVQVFGFWILARGVCDPNHPIELVSMQHGLCRLASAHDVYIGVAGTTPFVSHHSTEYSFVEKTCCVNCTADSYAKQRTNPKQNECAQDAHSRRLFCPLGPCASYPQEA